MARVGHLLDTHGKDCERTYEIEGKISVVFIVPPGQNYENGREFSIALVYIEPVQIFNRLYVEERLLRVSSEPFRRQFHQLDLLHAFLVDYYFCVEVGGEGDEDFFFAEVVGEEEDAVLGVRFDDTYQSLVRFKPRWEIVSWICKSIIQVQIINLHRHPPHRTVPQPLRTQHLMLQHLLIKPKIARMQHRPHLPLKQEHHRTRTMIRIHE